MLNTYMWPSYFMPPALRFNQVPAPYLSSFFNFPVMGPSIFNYAPMFDFMPMFTAAQKSPPPSQPPSPQQSPPAQKPEFKIPYKADPSIPGYNEHKAKQIVDDLMSHADGNIGDCALYIRKSLQRLGLSSGQYGDAHQWADNLRANPNFKEIKVSGDDLENLPAGCFVVYPPGEGGRLAQVYGHVGVTRGDGTDVSDHVKKTRLSDNAAVFIPV